MEKIHLKRTKRILSGHLWVFSNELYESPRKYEPGSVVELYDRQEGFLGIGTINPHSQIAVRILSRDKIVPDRSFLRTRIEAAISFRKRLTTPGEAVRLVFSEGDYLPGLIVDQYGSCLVIQLLTYGMEKLKEEIVSILDELVKPDLIVLRNDSRMRELENLSRYKEVVKGTLDTLPKAKHAGVLFEIDPLEGQKTGLFLDQGENRTAFAELVKEGRGLDLFCYAGGWALSLAMMGAKVTGVDSSARAVSSAQRNAELNDLSARATFERSDVFEFLKSQQGGDYDFIVCDPPAFVKSAEKLREGLRGYLALNEQCMRLLRKGGILASSSCSYQVSREVFLEMLLTAARHAGRRARLLALRSQGRDHPVLLAMPETEYLKCAFLVVD